MKRCLLMSDKKVVIVSGGSRGLGREIALSLAADGYIPIITYINNQDKAGQIVRQITDGGGEAEAIKADVGDFDAVEHLFQDVKTRFGRIDAVINTAAIAILKPLAEFTPAEFASVLATNTAGTFNILQIAAKYLDKGGRILTFSSNVVDTRPVNYTVYGASKSAVETMSKIFAKELRGREITVNVISPGPTKTEMFLDGKSPEFIAQTASLSPFGRLGEPEDIYPAVAFLLSPQAAWVNGQVIKVNGGAS